MLAPYITEGDKVVLFDGVCKLCSAWAKFLIKFDKQRVFKLATVQSHEGQAILKFYGLPTETFETMALIHGETLYMQSSAFLKVMKLLPFPWPLFSIFTLLPNTIRDWLYNRVASNRYALFGKYDTCLIPAADHESRFLHGKQ